MPRVLRGGLLLGVADPGAGREEVQFGGSEVGVGVLLPFQRMTEPGPPIELAVRPAHPVPGVR